MGRLSRTVQGGESRVHYRPRIPIGPMEGKSDNGKKPIALGAPTGDFRTRISRRVREIDPRHAARLAVLCATYFGAAKAGLAFAFTNESVTSIWPPTGLALAAVLIWGYRMWPAI